MAQHKAPTAVTIAPVRESSGFALWVERYWKICAVLAISATAVILYLEYSKHAARATHDLSWERLMGIATEDRMVGQITGAPEELQALAGREKGNHAAPWALYIAATSAVNERKYEEAKRALAKLRAEYPEHQLVKDTFLVDDAEGALSVVDRLDRRIDAQMTLVGSRPALFENPALPPDAPRVRLKTDRGDIVVGLYSALAPKHADNFLKLVSEGKYAGTKFHRVMSGAMIEGGDPNSVAGDPSTWGQGGSEAKLDKEENELKHFPGVLAASKEPGDEKSSGTQFLITTGSAHYLDGQNVVFGTVLEGMDIVHQIERSKLVEGTMRPEDPVTIQSAEVL